MSTSVSSNNTLALRQVYAVLFEHGKLFFIGTTSSSLSQIYYDHQKGRRYTTRAAALAETSFGASPRLYLLHTLHGTAADAFPYLVVWACVLQDAGYACLNPRGFCQRLQCPTPEETALYQSLAVHAVEEIFSSEKALFPKPTSDKSSNPSKRTITVTVSAQEHAAYTARAEECGISISELTRECLRLGSHVSIDLSTLTGCLRGIEQCQRLLHEALARYTTSGACTPSGCAELRAISDRLQQSTSEVTHEVSRLCKKLQVVVRGTKPLADLQL